MDAVGTSRVRSTAKARIFINYRSSDAGWAVHLDNVLSARFGSDRVFRASRSIQPGEDFIDRILSAVESSKVLVAVVGPGWLNATDRTGGRALDNERDWVRREIAHALRQRVQVLPLLVDNTPPLGPGDLPDDIAALARCQYVRMNYRAAQADTQRVGDELVKLIPELGHTASRRKERRLLAAISMTLTVILVTGIAAWFTRDRPNSASLSLLPTSPPALASPPATAEPTRTRTPWIAVRPAQGGPTDPFQIKGAGFSPRQRVALSISTDNTWLDMDPAHTNDFGELVADFNPRTGTGKGRLTVGAHFIATNANNDRQFHVTAKYTVVG